MLMLRVLTLAEILPPKWRGKGDSVSPQVGEWLQPRGSIPDAIKADYRVFNGRNIYCALVKCKILNELKTVPIFKESSAQ